MIRLERLCELANEANRVKKKYSPKKTADFERIATEEYGVNEVVKTFLTCPSRIIKTEGKKIYIFYHADYEPYLNLALSHEIGHLAAIHFVSHDLNLYQMEDEADYFSACLNNISLEYLHECRDNDIKESLKFKTILFKFLKKKDEKIRMQLLGYHIYI